MTNTFCSSPSFLFLLSTTTALSLNNPPSMADPSSSLLDDVNVSLNAMDISIIEHSDATTIDTSIAFPDIMDTSIIADGDTSYQEENNGALSGINDVNNSSQQEAVNINAPADEAARQKALDAKFEDECRMFLRLIITYPHKHNGVTTAAVLINDLLAFIDEFIDRSRVKVLNTFTNNRQAKSWRCLFPGGQRLNFVRRSSCLYE